MLAELSAAWAATNTTAKAIAGLLKTVQSAETKAAIADVQNSLLDLQSKLFAAQAQYEALAEVKRQLEQKIVDYEKWDADAARYELTEVASGIFVYALKANDQKGEPMHWLCPNCFNQHQKSILGKPGVDYLNYKCNNCSFNITPTPFSHPVIESIPRPNWVDI